MKKSRRLVLFWQDSSKKTWFWRFLPFWLGLILLPQTIFSQEMKRISLEVKDEVIGEVMNKLGKEYGKDFFYSESQVDMQEKVTVHLRNVTLDEALKQIFNGKEVRYEERPDFVVILEVQMLKGMDNFTIHGVVKDDKNHPLPGVTIILKGTSLGTATNTNGEFVLNVVKGVDSLVVTSIGMKTLYIPLVKGKTEYMIRMEEEVKTLDDVVVTGYGNVAKGNYTGASTTVKMDDILMAGASSVDQMLQGVVPGMLVMNKTGLVGASPKIRVRGTSTLLGSQEPVWVVDGVIQRDPQPFDSEDNTKFSVDADDIRQLAGNAISWLNPNDIETITVLKDASATAIYGSKAANGVIVITTKKATQGDIAVNYNGDFSIGQRPHYGLYDQMNSKEIMQFSKDIYDERGSYTSSILPIGYAGLLQRLINKEITLEEMDREYQKMAQQNTDWFKLLFRNSLNHSHNVSISGGNGKVLNRTSFGYAGEKGEAKGNDVNLFTATSNTTVNFGQKLMINLLLKGSIRNVNGFAYNVDPFSYAYNTSRAIPAYNEDGSLFFHEKIGEYSPSGSGKYMYNYNILNERGHTGSKNDTRTWGSTIDLKWRILPGLEYQGMFSYASSSSDSKKYASEHSFYITQLRGYEYGAAAANSTEMKSSPLPVGGILETDLINTTTVMVRNSLVYDQLFKEKHRFTLQVGIETNSVKSKGGSSKRYGYLPDRGETFATPPITYLSYGSETSNSDIVNGASSVVNRKENALSEYMSVVYTYNDLYVINFNGRIDASNRFAQDKNKRFEPTWSVGLKWRIANERFAQDLWWLNNLDFYASYGYQGNAVTTVSPYLIAYDGGIDTRYQDFVLKIKSLPYPDLGWEKTKTYNLGLDGALLNGRFNFTLNYYQKISEVLSSRNVPYENGVANGIVSGSTMKNYGYDFVIDVIPIRTKDVTWQLSLNTAVSRNKIDKNKRVNTLNDYIEGSAIIPRSPFSTFYSYQFAGLNSENGLPVFDKMDIEGANTPADFLVESGKFMPDFSGGLNTMIKYKSFSLYALFTIQWGGHARLPELYTGATSTQPGLPRPEQNVSRKLRHRWKKSGDEQFTNIPSLPGTGNETIMLPATATSTSVSTNLYYMYNLSDVRVANTDFIRCRSISLAYEFKQPWLERFFIRRMQVKASMTNPFSWVSDKKWDGLDPETGNWPTRRVTSLSLQVSF